MVPLDEKGKLNCRALFGGSRYRLSELQDDFALAMKPLGLERGIKGSRAKHTEVRKYYAAINRPMLVWTFKPCSNSLQIGKEQ
jgi:hypothetical protein